MLGLGKRKKISKYTDIEASYKRVRHRKWKLNRILKIIKSPQVIGHVASVVTILVALNTELGKNKLISLILAILGIVLIIVGIYSMTSLINREVKAIVNYAELHDFLTVARYEAENSIVNIGGDLSWLKQDIETICDIKSEHPNVHIKIYYDKSKLSSETKKLISDLQSGNIVQLIPYPSGIPIPEIRCMITDFGDSELENCKIYIYPKKESENTSKHINDKFEWQEYTYKTNPNLYNSVASLLSLLNSVKRHQVIVGVSGLNNTGKTSIIYKCKEILQKNFTVRIIPDDFQHISKSKDYSYINQQIIFNQLSNLNTNYKEDIIIFDRTPFDNYIYLVMRQMTKKFVIQSDRAKKDLYFEYNKMIREQMNNFSIICNVQRKKEDLKLNTTYISAKQRKCLINLYKELSQEFLPRDIFEFKISGESFEKDILEAASNLSLCIQEYYYTGEPCNNKPFDY